MYIEFDKNTFKNVLFNNQAACNLFACSHFEEIHFDTFEIKANGIDFIKEKVGTHNDNPVVLFDVQYKGELYKNIPFTLVKQKNTIINENLLVDPQPVEFLTEKVSVIADQNLVEVEDTSPIIDTNIVVEQYGKIKNDAINAKRKLVEEQQQYTTYINNCIYSSMTKAYDKLKSLLEQHKSNLLASLSDKNVEIISENKGKVIAELDILEETICKNLESKVNEIIDNNIDVVKNAGLEAINTSKTSITATLHECKDALNSDIENGIKYFHSSIHDTISRLNESAALTYDIASKKLDDQITLCEQQIEIKFDQLKTELIKNAATLVESKLNDLKDTTITDLNVQLNDKIARFNQLDVNATDTIQTIKEEFTQVVESINSALNQSVTNAVQSAFNINADPIIESKISLVKDELINLIHSETLQTQIFSEAKKEAVEKVANIFSEAKSNNKLDVIFKENREKLIDEIKSISEQYSKNLEKRFRIYSESVAGGGSNALQLANGGTINGVLNVAHQILSGGVDIVTLFGTGGGGSGDTAATTLVRASSADWSGVYSTVNTNSATWGAGGGDDVAASTFIRSNSANYTSNYNTTFTLSSRWENNFTTYNAASSNWQSVFTTVNANSAQWAIDTGDDVAASTFVRSNSSNIVSNYNTVNILSSRWENSFTSVNSSSANWQNVFTTVNANSAQWATDTGDDVAVSTFVRSNSSNVVSNYNTTNVLSSRWENNYTTYNIASASWQSVFTTVNTNSAAWSAGSDDINASTFVRTNSSNIVSNYNTTNTLSSNWQNVFSVVNANSATWGGGSDDADASTFVRTNSSDIVSNYNTTNSLSSRWENSYTWVNTNSSTLTIGNLDTRYVNVTGDTITGALSVTQTVNIGDVQFTGLTSVAVASVSATNTFLQINIGPITKYIRLYDIL